MPDDTVETNLPFAQAMQSFLVHRILSKRYTRGTMMRSDALHEFFGEWSRLVREQNAPQCLERIPTAIAEHVPEPRVRPGGLDSDSSNTRAERFEGVPEVYWPIMAEPRFSGFLEFLKDRDLGDLMKVPYPGIEQARELAGGIAELQHGDPLREAIARDLGVDAGDVTLDEYKRVTEFNAAGSGITDLRALKVLTNLRELYLADRGLADLEPLRGLGNLQVLDLTNTHVADIQPLRGLRNLRSLYLVNTNVADLEPLGDLSSLRKLNLCGTRIYNLEPVRGLNCLETLDLSRTPVVDLEPLRGLTILRTLQLSYTKVVNVEPLKGLSSLRSLYLYGTQIPRQQLKALQLALPHCEIVPSSERNR